MSESTKTSTQREMQDLLRSARRRLARERLKNSLRTCINPLLTVIAIGLVLLVAGRMASAMGWTASRHWDTGLAGVVTFAGLLFLAVRLVRRLRKPISPAEAAERLDAAVGDDNRIATAWYLAHQQTPSSFGVAAIKQGIHSLRLVAEHPPALPLAPSGRIRTAALAGVIGVLSGLYCFMPLPVRQAGPALAVGIERIVAAVPPASAPSQASASKPADVAAANLAEATKTPARPETQPSAHIEKSSGGSRSAAADSLASARSGSSRQQAPGDPRQTAAGRRAGETSRADRSNRKPGRGAPGVSGKETADKQESLTSGAISGNGGQVGQTLALANRADLHEHSVQPETEGKDNDQALEPQQKGNQQRGGLQPALPDRTAAPSRELGITGQQSGKPGTGRGGPTPAKKSRGVASLMMGVALPDFIRGKTGPGPAAVNIDNMDPIPSPESTAPGNPPLARSLEESPVPPSLVSWVDARTVMMYLTAWHASDRHVLDPRGRPDAPAAAVTGKE